MAQKRGNKIAVTLYFVLLLLLLLVLGIYLFNLYPCSQTSLQGTS